MNISFILNDKNINIESEPTRTLAEVLREDLELTGTKVGCARGECGACTVIMDGKAINSCLILIPQVGGSTIITIEGLSKNGELDPIQETFIEEGVIQCGYCIPGMIMSAKALLIRNPNPSENDIKRAISGNLCRCTGYIKIIQSIKKAAAKISS